MHSQHWRTVESGDKPGGSFELQLGALASITGNVTLMIFDDSTDVAALDLPQRSLIASLRVACLKLAAILLLRSLLAKVLIATVPM